MIRNIIQFGILIITYSFLLLGREAFEELKENRDTGTLTIFTDKDILYVNMVDKSITFEANDSIINYKNFTELEKLINELTKNNIYYDTGSSY